MKTERDVAVKGRRGFSLVEILIAIGIVVVLASLTLGAMQKAASRAADAGCLNNLRQMGGMLQQFSIENYGYLPSSYRNSTGQYWFEQMADAASAVQGDTQHPATAKNVFMCPASKLSWRVENRKFHGNYGWNIAYGNQWNDTDPAASVKRERRDLQKWGEAAVVADVGPGSYSPPDAIHWFSYSGTSFSYLDFRHGGGQRLHVLFADGGARSITREEATSDFFNSSKHRRD